MNKKGIFVALLSVITLLLLVATAIVLIKNNDVRLEKVHAQIGQDAASTFLLYDEYQKYKIYVHEAVPFAEQRAKEKVAKNGGYAQNNSCEKITQSISDIYPYILLNTCDAFNPKQAYYTQLATELESYLQGYVPIESTICRTKQREGLHVNLDAAGLHLKQQFPLKECTQEQQTAFALNAQIDEPLEEFDAETYEYLYDILASCSDVEACKEKVGILLPESTREIEQETLFIASRDLKLAFRQGSLPQRQQSSLFNA